jgi:anti-sigma B factor antagonist
MEISQQTIAPGKSVIRLQGKVMISEAPDRIGAAVEALVQAGTRTVIIDLSGVTALDSTGIGYLIAGYNRIMAAGGDMRMAGATGHILQNFRVNQLDRVFAFYPSVEEAAKE